MTDDLDCRIRKIVAEAFRMMQGNTTAGISINAYFGRVADALDPPEPASKPCPFCGERPLKSTGTIGLVSCPNGQCPIWWCWRTVEQWNRRAEVPHG